MHKRWILLTAVVAAVLAAGCSREQPGGSADGTTARGRVLNVVATTTQVADLAANVGGDRVQVTSLLKPGIDAHDYEPSPADIDAIARADLVLQNGVGLEEWLGDTIESSGYRGPLVDTSSGVRLRQVGGEPDPHIWQNPRNAQQMAANFERALAAAEPVDASAVNHYGLEFVGSIIPSFDTSAELSGRDIRDLVAKIKATGVKAVFSETSLPPKTAETIGREAGVKVVTGDDALYGDALGPPGSDGDTYLKMLRHNTATIVGNLSGA